MSNKPDTTLANANDQRIEELEKLVADLRADLDRLLANLTSEQSPHDPSDRP